jgi:DNA-binding SARP family transcriptional activator
VAHLAISLLGPFQVTLDGEPVTRFKSDKVRALLAYLAVECGRPHRRETLAGLLWPEWPDREALNNLRYTLSSLRQTIDDQQAVSPFLLITRDTLQFNTVSNHWLDVSDFGTRIADSGGSHGGSEIEHLEIAIGLYRGSFLEGFSVRDAAPFEEWALLKRERLSRQMLESLYRLAIAREQRGEYAQARLHAQRQVELEPWNEEAHQQLMRLLARGGQRSAALAQYETCRRVLAEELGVEPGRESRTLYESIRDGTLMPAMPATRTGEAPVSGEPPFQGLHYFDIADAEWFFGREELSAQLASHLAEHH